MRSLLFAAVLGAAASVSAQADHFESSPAGFEFLEGGGDERDLIGKEPLLRYQQVDATSLFAEANRNRVAFRRDGYLVDNPLYGARTVDLEITMGEGDITTLGIFFAQNYKTNVATVVTRKQVQFPDWSIAPNFPPAPTDLVIFFDQLWSYPGKAASGNDLVWEMKVWSNTGAGTQYPLDFDLVVPGSVFGTPPPTHSLHTDIGTGCIAGGRIKDFHLETDFLNWKTKFSLDLDITEAPANAPLTLMVSGFDINYAPPTLCRTLNAGPPGFAVPIGTASMAGSLLLSIDPIAYNASWIGLDMYTQAVAPDASQAPKWPVVLTNGNKFTIPADPKTPLAGRIWALNPNAAVATYGPRTGGIIIQTNHL